MTSKEAVVPLLEHSPPTKFRRASLRPPGFGVAQVAGRNLPSIAIISFICFVLFFYGLGAGELYRTEGLRAIIAQEFLRSGNWIVPRLYGEPFFSKPPGMYAAIALASWPQGHVSEWSARMPSALAATATVFLFYWYFARALGRAGGLTAAVILPLSLAWLDKASAAEIDMMQVAWVNGSVLFFLRALELAEDDTSVLGPNVIQGRYSVEENGDQIIHQDLSRSGKRTGHKQWFWWLAALLCVAGGVLTKWTAPVFFYGTIVPLLWWRGRLRLLFGRHHLASAFLAAGICVAWVVAAALLEGWSPIYETVRREALVHLSPQRHHRAYPWQETLTHPLKIWLVNLSWSAVALLGLWPGFTSVWDERGRRLIQALHCWIWPNLVFWSLIPQHSVRHSFPFFPAVSGLAAMVWIAAMTSGSRTDFNPCNVPGWLTFVKRVLPRPSIILLSLVVVWTGVRLVYVHTVIPSRDLARQPREKGERIAQLVPGDQTLFLLDLKDDGLMFYYDRAVRRLPSPAHLPRGQKTFCLLTESEWDSFGSREDAKIIERLSDQQGAPIILVRIDK
jgi:4-amino-4-deoxy-L-arabinose transferase-like glycosyltransferase